LSASVFRSLDRKDETAPALVTFRLAELVVPEREPEPLPNYLNEFEFWWRLSGA